MVAARLSWAVFALLVTPCRWLLLTVGPTRMEKPRHAKHEAGLIITSDLRPARPGSYTRRLASLEISIFVCVFDLANR